MENKTLGNLGEIELIKIIEELVLEKTGKDLLKDDSFFFPLNEKIGSPIDPQTELVLNSDMLVSSTDIPTQMNYFQIGQKAVLMNISDLIVKAVEPKAIIVSLGAPFNLELKRFEDLILGIINYSMKFNMDYIGGDLNETKEIIVNPTVFGFQKKDKIIYRKGMREGDYLVANGKFGLTGVGFDILLNEDGNLKDFPDYKRSIESVLEPQDLGKESFILSESNLATTSIDSSDGLTKSLFDLLRSNRGLGFEICFNDELIDKEALKYSNEFNIPLENLIFNGGEEFIHLFTINSKDFKNVLEKIKSQGGQLYKIGKVISEEKIFFFKEGQKIDIKGSGYEHFK